MSDPTEPRRLLRMVGADAGEEVALDDDKAAAAFASAAGRRHRRVGGSWTSTIEQAARLDATLDDLDRLRGGISPETLDLRAILELLFAAPAMEALLPELEPLVRSRVTTIVRGLSVLIDPLGREGEPRRHLAVVPPMLPVLPVTAVTLAVAGEVPVENSEIPRCFATIDAKPGHEDVSDPTATNVTERYRAFQPAEIGDGPAGQYSESERVRQAAPERTKPPDLGAPRQARQAATERDSEGK